jgi:collagen type VII alpha
MYRVEKRRFGSNDYELVSAKVSNQRFTVSGLQAGESYYLRVCAGVNGSFESCGCETSITLLDPIADLCVDSMTFDTVTLSWNPVANATKYQIELRTITDNFEVYADNVTSCYVCLGDLESSVAYEFRVRAGTDVGFAYESSQVTGMPLPPISLLDVVDLKTHSITLRWQGVPGATQYSVEYTSNAQQDNALQLASDSITSTEFSLSGLTPSLAHTVLVRAGYNGSFETQGYEFSVVPLEPVSGLRAEKLTTKSVTLAWNPVKGANMYKVQHKAIDSDVEVIADDLRGNLIDLVDVIRPGIENSIRVFSGCDGMFETIGAQIELNVVVKPLDVKVTALTATSASLEWDKAKGVTAYKVEKKLMNVGDDFAVVSDSCIGNTFTLPNLMSGSTYSVRISAGFKGTFQTDGTILRITPLSTVQNLEISHVTFSSVTLSWQGVLGATCYRVEHKDESGSFNTICEMPGTTIQVTDITAGDENEFKVYAGIGDANSPTAQFETVGAWVSAVPLAPPANIQSRITEDDIIELSWTPALGANMYKIQKKFQGESDEKYVSVADALQIRSFSSSVESGKEIVFRICSGRNGVFESEGQTATVTCLSPPDVNVVSVTADSISLQWNKVHGATLYGVEFRPRGGDDGDYIFSQVWNCTHEQNNLETGEVYLFRVFSGNEHGLETSGSRTVEAVPLAPVTDLAAVVIESTTARLSWTHSKGATRYVLLKRETGEQQFSLVTDMITTNEVDVEDLDPETPCQFAVHAACGPVVEGVGAIVDFDPNINLQPRNAKELERTIDALMLRNLRELENDIVGLVEIVFKVGANHYQVGDRNVRLTLQKGTIVVRVGGGFMEFSAWILQHKLNLKRFVASTAQRVSSKSGQVTMIRAGNVRRPPGAARQVSRSIAITEAAAESGDNEAYEYEMEQAPSRLSRSASLPPIEALDDTDAVPEWAATNSAARIQNTVRRLGELNSDRTKSNEAP